MVSNSLKISNEVDLKYPRSIGFIICNEFCERFNFYGMRTILVLYLTRKLAYTNDTATILFHVFTCLVYFFPLFGAIIADSWLGRFKTIIYLSLVYSLGTIIVSVGAIPSLSGVANEATIIGLCLIALGTGGIKPCVSAFGGDQFKLPEQIKQLATFFSLFYFAINAGSLISTSITPILREDVYCFGQTDCYSLAFGVPAILMIISIIVLIFGKPLYIIKEPTENMLLSVTTCIAEAIKNRRTQRKTDPKAHWLDYAEGKYGRQLVEDTKSLLKILILYIPLPIFWALFDQQGSRWTFQATQMVGRTGSFTIKPDQMQVINPLLILAFIPLFEYILYPLLRKIGLKKPLHKLAIGGLLASIAFILSGVVETELEKTYPIVPDAQTGQMRIFNAMQCEYKFTTNIPHHKSFSILPQSIYTEKMMKVSSQEFYDYEAHSDDNENCPPLTGRIKLRSRSAMSYVISSSGSNSTLLGYRDFVKKPKGLPLVRFLVNVESGGQLELQGPEHNTMIDVHNMSLFDLPEGAYAVSLKNKMIDTFNIELGGVYSVLIVGSNSTGYNMNVFTITEPNTLHMMWQLPQYIVITAGEVMFSVTGLEFSFTEAPSNMKSVIQAAWLLTVAMGNLIVVLVAEIRVSDSQSKEFFLFAGLMLADMFIFIMLSMRFEYVKTDTAGDTYPDADSPRDDSGNRRSTSTKYDNPTFNQKE